MDAHKNFSKSTVATAPSPASSGTSLVVASGDGALFPAVPFNATVWPTGSAPTSANAEIVRVTARASDTLTITRAQEGSSARSILVGDNIAATVTAKTLTDVENAIAFQHANITTVAYSGAAAGDAMTVAVPALSVNDEVEIVATSAMTNVHGLGAYLRETTNGFTLLPATGSSPSKSLIYKIRMRYTANGYLVTGTAYNEVDGALPCGNVATSGTSGRWTAGFSVAFHIDGWSGGDTLNGTIIARTIKGS